MHQFVKTFFKTSFLFLPCFFMVFTSNGLDVTSSYFKILSTGEAHEPNNRETLLVARDTSRLSCALRCNTRPDCMIVGYQKQTGVCRIFGRKTKNACGNESSDNNGKTRTIYLKKLGYYDENTGQFVKPQLESGDKDSKIYRSCKEIFVDYKSSGVYKVTLLDGSVAQVYCMMENIIGCDGRGWGLALKINGSESTFTYNSAFWSNNISYNYPQSLDKLDRKEMKSPIFWGTQVTKICIGMRNSENEIKWLMINQTHKSLQSVFSSNVFHATNLGSHLWFTLLKGSRLPGTICGQGLNVIIGNGSSMKVRIGIIGSGIQNCHNPKGFLGFGPLVWTACGSVVLASHPKTIKAFGYVLIQ